MRRPLYDILAVAAVLAGGCSSALGDVPDVVGRRCFTDADCDPTLSEECRRNDGSLVPDVVDGLELLPGVCVIPSPSASADIFLEVRPDAASGLGVSQLGPIALSKGQNHSLVLPKEVEVSGSVRYADDASAVGGARVRFRSKPLIPGRVTTFEATTSIEDGSLGAFARRVPAGTYMMSVQPPDLRVGSETWPAPLERPLGEADTGVLDAARQFDLVVSGVTQLIPVSGQAMVTRYGIEQVPLAGIGVWAVELKSPGDGQVLPECGTRPMSQVARAGTDGRFRVWLPRVPAGASEHAFCLRFGPVDEGSTWPTFAPRTVFHAKERFELPEVLVLGELGPTERVDGVVFTIEGELLPNASVTLRTRPDAPFTVVARTTTNDFGRFTAEVPPGLYDIVVLRDGGRGGSPFALCVPPQPLPVIADRPNELTIRCPKKTTLTGEVRSPRSGQALPGVKVVVTRRPDATISDERRAEVETDARGVFELELGGGRFDVSVEPGPELRLPFQLLRELEMLPGVDRTVVVLLPTAFELFGTLESPDRTGPVSGTVDAWAIEADNPPRLVGRGIATADGYSVVVPAIVE